MVQPTPAFCIQTDALTDFTSCASNIQSCSPFSDSGTQKVPPNVGVAIIKYNPNCSTSTAFLLALPSFPHFPLLSKTQGHTLLQKAVDPKMEAPWSFSLSWPHQRAGQSLTLQAPFLCQAWPTRAFTRKPLEDAILDGPEAGCTLQPDMLWRTLHYQERIRVTSGKRVLARGSLTLRRRFIFLHAAVTSPMKAESSSKQLLSGFMLLDLKWIDLFNVFKWKSTPTYRRSCHLFHQHPSSNSNIDRRKHPSD